MKSSAGSKRRNILILAIEFLLIGAIGLRGLIQYPEKAPMLSLLLGFFLVTMVFEKLAASKPQSLGRLYLSVQLLITMGLFLTAPVADYWAIMLMPTIIFAMRYNSRREGIIWVVFITSSMSGMLIYTEGLEYAPQYVTTYVAAFILVSSYALMLRQTEESEEESREVQDQLSRANDQLKANAQRIEELAKVNERTRLARELHDSVTQTIFSITLIAKSTGILLEKDPGKVPQKLVDLQELSQAALTEMRDLIYQLRPAPGVQENFISLLKQHLQDRYDRDGLVIDLVSNGRTFAPDDEIGAELFRIIQESINNIAKHAGTKNGNVRLDFDGKHFKVEVEDDGVGFDPEHPVNGTDGRHFGLGNIEDRVKALDGRLEIVASPGQGTRIGIVIPFKRSGGSNV